MARYFFDIDNGEPIVDDEGIDTLNPEIVPATALQMLVRMTALHAVVSGHVVTVTVRDASDHVVFRVALTLLATAIGD